ncbi:GH92 family glycosyl hydrolase [Enterococcus faecium]|uniref:GH92 family glycosyl hydrolase n=1 Tax=Enterococcus faecium TaxID=1352 RepID=UPI001BDA782D|nr:GH92 family glycosyl hydrolase [Enterococcus faecium]MBT0736474.1 GH92 family glycosyl hydrolase [Enterococcus faecium]MEB8309540.1 GH92 family glycosyl hydrolase [Enterococcus faecium]
MNIGQIDTRHATANQPNFSNGNCQPYTGVPFGMNYFAPQTTDQNGSWWFHPDDRVFQGYRLTHQPSPWMGDFSHMLFTPINGKLQENTLFHAQSSYRPEESIFCPTHLSICQLRYGICSTLIPSMYGGILSIDYSKNDSGLLLSFPGRHQLFIIDPYTVEGKITHFAGSEDPDFSFYFILRFEYPLTIDELAVSNKNSDSIPLYFEQTKKQTIRFGTSFISSEQAAYNLELEQNQSKETYLAHSQEQWQSYFDRIQLTHHDQQQLRTFYHNLYRVFLFPQTFYEIDPSGQKIHYDTTSRSIKPGVLYTNNGFWDTYKTVYPLYSLIAVEKYEEMLEGFLNSYRESGYLPKWLSPDERGLMPGTLIDAVIADAAVKDIRRDLMPEFLTAMEKGATVQSKHPNYGRQGTEDYLTYGYVPNHYHESVNHTLDYAYSDFCISQVAKVLEEEEMTKKYQQQSLNYQNIFDYESGFMRSKDKDGKFREPFSANRWGQDYAEGSAWQSSFAVYHDFSGLIGKYGGSERYKEKLIELCNQPPTFDPGGYGFEIHEMSEMAAIEFGQLAISNQPSFHYPYLFSYIGQPEMAQPLLKQLMTQTFDDSPMGYPGDEDNGSMAAWYIFNSLGFYPVTPGTGEYVIGMPLIDKAVLLLSNGKELTIEATPNRPQQQFIHKIKRMDKEYTKLYFTHQDLLKGGTISYQLGIIPHPKKYQAKDLPFSLSNYN